MLLIRHIRINQYRRKPLLILLVSTCFFIIIFIFCHITPPRFIIKLYYWVRPEQGVFCHYSEGMQSLPEILPVISRERESIFFHETSCNSYMNGKLFITSRQACAVESAARMNPDYNVYLLYASPGTYLFENTESDRFLRELMEYENINILHIDMEKYFMGSPVQNLWTEGKMRDSLYAQSHTSDVLRFLTLWKYGGIYLDLDVIVTKSLKNLGTNFSGVESNTSVAAGVLSFNHTGDGHEYATSSLENLKKDFRGDDWGWNGPGTVTRLLKKLCKVNTVNKMVNKSCKGFRIYPPNEFYAIPWWNWEWFFDATFFKQVKELSNSSHVIHVWNKFSSSRKIPLGSIGVPYLELAKQYCPNIVKQCNQYF